MLRSLYLCDYFHDIVAIVLSHSDFVRINTELELCVID